MKSAPIVEKYLSVHSYFIPQQILERTVSSSSLHNLQRIYRNGSTGLPDLRCTSTTLPPAHIPPWHLWDILLYTHIPYHTSTLPCIPIGFSPIFISHPITVLYIHSASLPSLHLTWASVRHALVYWHPILALCSAHTLPAAHSIALTTLENLSWWVGHITIGWTGLFGVILHLEMVRSTEIISVSSYTTVVKRLTTTARTPVIMRNATLIKKFIFHTLSGKP